MVEVGEDSIVCQIASKKNVTYMNEKYYKKVAHVDRNPSLMSLATQKEVTCVIVLDPLLTVHSGLSAESTSRALKSQAQ